MIIYLYLANVRNWSHSQSLALEIKSVLRYVFFKIDVEYVVES